jgi:cold shock protein
MRNLIPPKVRPTAASSGLNGQLRQPGGVAIFPSHQKQKVEMTKMISGVVKFFNREKGFGFIQPDDRSLPDAFVHAHALARNGVLALDSGDRVEYSLEISAKNGREAVSKIRLLPR